MTRTFRTRIDAFSVCLCFLNTWNETLMQNTIERKCNRGPAINPDEKIERKGKKGDGTTLKPVNSCFRGRVRARTIPHVRNQTSPKTRNFSGQFCGHLVLRIRYYLVSCTSCFQLKVSHCDKNCPSMKDTKRLKRRMNARR